MLSQVILHQLNHVMLHQKISDATRKKRFFHITLETIEFPSFEGASFLWVTVLIGNILSFDFFYDQLNDVESVSSNIV